MIVNAKPANALDIQQVQQYINDCPTLAAVCTYMEKLGFQLWWENHCPTALTFQAVCASHPNDPQGKYIAVGTNPEDFYGVQVCDSQGNQLHLLPTVDLQTINVVAALVFGVDVP